MGRYDDDGFSSQQVTDHEQMNDEPVYVYCLNFIIITLMHFLKTNPFIVGRFNKLAHHVPPLANKINVVPVQRPRIGKRFEC